MESKSGYPHQEEAGHQQNMYPNIPSAQPPSYDQATIPPPQHTTIIHSKKNSSETHDLINKSTIF